MTVSYSYDISKVDFTSVIKLLCRWRGSVLKVVAREGVVYFACYAVISLTWRLALNEDQQFNFMVLARYCQRFADMIPTTFILGFYVSIVYGRWNFILLSLPWPDTPDMFISNYLKDMRGDDKSLIYRRTILRYLVACSVMAFRNISMAVRKRFPTFQHIVDSGLLTKEEQVMIENTVSTSGDAKQWIPAQWACAIIARARAEGRITSDIFANECTIRINTYRGMVGDMLVMDGTNIPLVYTQIVTIAVWCKFAAALFANQVWVWPEDSKDPYTKDLYVPVFTIIQFICLIGWLRVAQDMLNPLGEADDDFELNGIIDRNLTVGMLQMDTNSGRIPGMTADLFMDQEIPELPHTEASKEAAGHMTLPSVMDVEFASFSPRRGRDPRTPTHRGFKGSRRPHDLALRHRRRVRFFLTQEKKRSPNSHTPRLQRKPPAT